VYNVHIRVSEVALMTPDLSTFVVADAVASSVAWVGAYKI
jgi:hypothetical protein